MRCKQFIIVSLAGVVLAASLASCGGAVPASSAAASSAASSVVASSAVAKAALPDGVYTADFETDSSMFHTSEACNGKGTLTVENGVMTFHVSLASKKIVNLYPGLAADAEANKTAWLIPTVDTVTYADGTTEEVYGYDIPVEALDTDFQLALLGTKGKWYDHIVSVRNAEPKTEQAAEIPTDGAYTAAVVLEGGSGRATVESPAALTVAEGKMTATIVWSSPNYDYMIVDGEKYLPTNTEGNSTFEIPVAALDTDFQLALLGTKGKWYDHTVSVRNAEPKTEQAAETPADGAYTAAVVLEGGSGRATVESPAALTVAEGKMTATIVWSSPNYDYMIVDGEKYLPTNTEGNSTFEIPVAALGTPLVVTADTVAMSKPHEIEYTLTFTLE